MRTQNFSDEWHKGGLLQVTSFDNFVWREYDGKAFSSDVFQTLSFPDVVIPLGEEAKNFRGDSYIRVLSAIGVVWIGQWCLGFVKEKANE